MKYKQILSFCIRNFRNNVDKTILSAVLILTLIGWMALSSVGSAVAGRISATSSIFAKKQLIFSVVGIILMFLISTTKRNIIFAYSTILTCILILFLLAVLFFGNEIKGSKRWLVIFGFAMQPSELLKPFFLVINGLILSNKIMVMMKKLIFSFVFLLLIVSLLILEPDFGMTMIYCSSWLVQVWIAGGPMIILFLGGISVFSILTIAYFTFDYINYRITTFFMSVFGGGSNTYQAHKAMKSIERGGWFGVGIAEGEVKYQLPDAHSDYIFAFIAEEWGVLMCMFILTIYAYIVFRSISILNTITAIENRVIGLGIVFMLALQVFINVGVNTNMLPSKGTVLPFISYGGSATISYSILIGILTVLLHDRCTIKNLFELYKKRTINFVNIK